MENKIELIKLMLEELNIKTVAFNIARGDGKKIQMVCNGDKAWIEVDGKELSAPKLLEVALENCLNIKQWKTK